jgi:ABC-2 type transport system permease protein
MIGVLLKPKWLSFRNRWRKQSLAKRRSQDIVIFFFSLGIMLGMYQGTRWLLTQINSLPFLVYAPPSLPLGLMLLMLLGMIMISALAAVLGGLYLADDIELVLATPVSTLSFYLARFTNASFMVSWMPFVFIFPVLLAFGQAHSAPISFYPLALATLVPYFVIPTACAVVLASLIMAVIDPRWTKFLIALCLVLALIGIVHVADLLSTVLSSRNDPNQILRFVSTLSTASSTWSPSSWAATACSELLVPSGKSFGVRLILLYAVAIFCTTVGYIFIELLHSRGYTRARNTTRAVRNAPNRRAGRQRWSEPRLALISKEFRSIFRDLAQSTQVVFLIGICLLYLANLRMFVAIDSFPAETRVWWQNIFFIMHTSITAFFTSSICTRVVFSSVSLEGKYYWLLQISPIEIQSILKSKFLAWFVPISIVSAILFATGVFVIVGRWDVIAMYLVISFFVSYGIVGLGIGLGAYFADFSWDHPSQLALSLGSFVYMLASAALVIMNIFPLSILLRLEPATTNLLLFKNIAWITLLGSLVAALNMGVAKGAMRLGEKALKEGAA